MISNAISKNGLTGLAAMLVLAGCILPGPWDYTPSDKPTFRGIWASVYAVADRPADNVCFERQLSLDEGASDAFPFYDSASVGIAGVFSTGPSTLLLNPLYDTPNCFSGATGIHFLRNQSYQLTARFVWDSSGTEVVSVLHATAHIPQSFRISDTVVAPKLAQTGVVAAGPLDTNTNYQLSRFSYHRNDSVFYIGGTSQMNNLSHYYHSVRSADVNGVLVTQRYDTNAGRPITSFDVILGLKPDTSQFYYPGDIRRLILYPSTISQSGYNVLDSMGVVNVWFWSGRNRLYFYGTEKSYTDYINTNVGVDQNPKIKPLTNVQGGMGFFSGMVVDSFDVFIKTDAQTQVYDYAATRAYTCRDKGWFGSRDCAGWYHQFCKDNENRGDCHLDAVYRCLDPVVKASDTTGLCTAAQSYAATDTALNIEATRRFCIDNNYPTNVAACASVKNECVTGSLANGCQLVLWKSCELDYWKPAACTEGRKSYCREYGDTQKELCRDLN